MFVHRLLSYPLWCIFLGVYLLCSAGVVRATTVHIIPYRLLQNSQTIDAALLQGKQKQHIGSFTVTTQDCDEMRIYAVNTLLNSVEGVRNLELYIEGEQSGSTFKAPNNNHNKFVVTGKSLTEAQSVRLDIFADITEDFPEPYVYIQIPSNGIFVEIEGSCYMEGAAGGGDTIVQLSGEAQSSADSSGSKDGEVLVIPQEVVTLTDEDEHVLLDDPEEGEEEVAVVFTSTPVGSEVLLLGEEETMHAVAGEDLDAEDDGSTEGSGSAPFSDIQGHWAYPYIIDLYEDGIAEGYVDGTFRPDQELTRAELSKFTAQAFPTPLQKEPQVFPDVQEGAWFYSTVDMLSRANVIHGYGDGYFRPERRVSRAEAMKIFLLGAGDKRHEVEAVRTLYNPFRDMGTEDWFFPYVTRAFHKGVVSGKTADTFEPSGMVTRGEAAKVISLLRGVH